MTAKTFLVCGFSVVGAVVVVAAQLITTPAKSVWDGVYSDSQAKRGELVYGARCSRCHAADLTGENSRLLGARFMQDWREDTVDSLFRRTRAGMPFGSAGSLTDREYLDVIAFVLQQNGFPSGPEDLTVDIAPTVMIVGKEGPQPVPDFALVQTIGCLRQSGNEWTLTNTADPTRTRTPDITSEELKLLDAKPLGTTSYSLMEARAYKPESKKDQKVGVKGLLIRKPENRLNVTAIESLGPACSP